jgi:hypothetical protein
MGCSMVYGLTLHSKQLIRSHGWKQVVYELTIACPVMRRMRLAEAFLKLPVAPFMPGADFPLGGVGSAR